MRYLFVGNRKFVLKQMLDMELNVEKALVIDSSHLANDVKTLDVEYESICSKDDLLQQIDLIDPEILISNGCPFILPVEQMKKRLYVNIHPSFLPDLRGVDPVIGAILFQRDSGATCHLMNENIDDGDIISQVKIPYSEDLDVSMLYQLSFIAEVEVFISAHKQNFVPVKQQKLADNHIYYKRSENDRLISFDEDIQNIVNKVKAFNNKSQGCYFHYKGETFKVYDASIVANEYLGRHADSFENNQIVLVYEDTIIVKRDSLLKLNAISGNMSLMKTGDYIK